MNNFITKWMADCHVLGFVPTHRFLQSKSVQTLQTSFGGDYKLKSPMCIHTQKYHIHVKDPVVHVRVWQIM